MKSLSKRACRLKTLSWDADMTPQELEHIKITVEGWLNSQHLILGNFGLPVEVEDAPKPSGLQNLTREGWGEDACRDFLVRVLGWIPRNYNYGDGLKTIYPPLQGRFGDKNLNLAVGVLHELIEVKALSSFPEAVYQRWKFRQLHRHEYFGLPHISHCRAIVGPPIPTERYKKWLTQNPGSQIAENTPTTTKCNHASQSPVSPTFSAAHVGSDFKVENSVFVSASGQKATVHSCLTHSHYHKRLWDGGWGRRRKLVGVREISTANLYEGTPLPYDTKEIDLGSQLPNAMFAGKNRIESKHNHLPDKVQNDVNSPSADESVRRRYEDLRKEALTVVDKVPGVQNLNTFERQEQERQAVEAYRKSYETPATPGLFFDSGLDFKWGAGSSHPTTCKQSEELRNGDETVNVGAHGDKTDPISEENLEADSPRLTSRSEQNSPAEAEDTEGISVFSSTTERGTPFEETKDPTDISVVSESPVNVFRSTQDWAQEWMGRGAKLTAFDGAVDDFDFGFPPTSSQFENDINNTIYGERSSAPPQFNTSMEVNQGETRPPATSFSSARVKPLHVRKASSQSHLVRGQQASNSHEPHRGSSEKPAYPPRTSSIRSHKQYCDPAAIQPQATRAKPWSTPLNSEENSVATSGHYPSYYSTNDRAMDINTGRSTISSTKSPVSGTSSAIMGDFVPLDSPNMAGLQPTMEPLKVPMQCGRRPFQVPKVNPFEFEPTTPHNDVSRQTTFTDFIKQGQEVEPTRTPRSAHVKNARSEGNALYMMQTSAHLATPTKPHGQALSRCESSPNVSQLPFPSHRNCTASPDILQYYAEPRENEENNTPVRRGRSEDSTPRGRDIGGNQASQSPRRRQDHAQESPTRSPIGNSPQSSFSKSSSINRNMTRSPTKVLDDVYERDEYDEPLPNRSSKTPPSSPPKKRSRSPMKKMFGENGWLGQSPDEKPNPKLRPKKPFVTHMDFANRPKKIGMMEKLKNKFEEIAEKADLSPAGRSRSNSDKQKLTVLSISLGPPDQARIYMELELMLVHTANNFLMNQFSQGRMDVDTIKKTVDSWKNKGRPIVIEFMYDQATQRDLVVANQQNFRFHGEKAGSDIRINSMLYNWKQVANHMVIRTFCNADTVILKLLFDIEQILELLGAGEPMMIRLQQIRATATEMMRVARHNKEAKTNSQHSVRGREPPRASESSASSTFYSQSIEDPYGGLKLVPDSYTG